MAPGLRNFPCPDTEESCTNPACRQGHCVSTIEHEKKLAAIPYRDPHFMSDRDLERKSEREVLALIASLGGRVVRTIRFQG